MAAVSRTYLPGYTGSITVDGIVYPVENISYEHDPGLFDTTSSTSGGWACQEPGIQKVTFNFDTMVRINANSPVLPAFLGGFVYPLVFGLNGVNAFTGNVIITKKSTKVDLKGSITVSTTADSQGAPTGGLLAASGLVVTPTPSS